MRRVRGSRGGGAGAPLHADGQNAGATPLSTTTTTAPQSRRAQQRGVRFSTWCCGQLNRKCNNVSGEGACPSWIEAVRYVRGQVEEKHNGMECLEAAATRRAAAGADDTGDKCAFAKMMGAQVARQRALSNVEIFKRELVPLRAAERAAREAREEMEARLKEPASAAPDPRPAPLAAHLSLW